MCTKKKDSKSSWSDRPFLLSCYIDAMQDVYGIRPYVHRSMFSKFSVFEDDLREMEIFPRDYADTMARVLQKWTHSKRMVVVPVNVFCGDWALRRYLKISNSKYVEIKDDDYDADVHSELTVARMYISRNRTGNGNVCRMSDVVSELKPMLSDSWIRAYKSGGVRPSIEALEILCDEYGVQAISYNDLLSKLRGR